MRTYIGQVVEIIKRNDGADIDERGAVEKKIDNVREHRVLCSFVEETAVMSSAGSKR